MGRVEDQAVDIPQRCGWQYHLQCFHESKDLRLAGAFQFKAHHAAKPPSLEEPVCQCVLGMVGQSGVVDGGDSWLPGQPLGHNLGVGAVLAHAQRQGLEATQGQPRLLRSQIGAQQFLPLAQVAAPLG